MTDQTARTLTPNEHDRAWHAIEYAASQDDADPGTVLNAVLRALRIAPPTVEDEQADSPRLRAAARQAAGQPAADEAPQYGVDGCTCRPWTNRGDGARWCTPDDTVDMVAGWDPGPGCPRHPAAGLAAPTTHDTETPLAPLVTHTPGEAPPSFEKALDAIISAALHEAARRMEDAGYDDDAVNFLDLLAARQTAGAES